MQNKFFKRILSILLTAIILLSFVPAAGAAAENNAVAIINAEQIYVIMPDATHGFLAESIRHAEDELENLGMPYKLFKTADAEKQSEALDEAVRENAGAVVLWPVTGEPLRNAAQRVKDAGIPLIIYDRLIPGLEPACEVFCDNISIGKLAGEYFNKAFGEEIKSGGEINILAFTGDDSTVPAQRTQGFTEAAGKNINTVQSFYTGWSKDSARKQMQDYLNDTDISEIESIRAIYTHDDEIVSGVMKAINDYNGSAELNIRVISGVGGNRDLLMHADYYKKYFGIDLVTYQHPPAMVREAIKDGARAASGDKLDSKNIIGTTEINSQTLGKYIASEAYQTRYASALPCFDDVTPDDWYYSAVSGIAVEGFMGTSGSFKPDAPVTSDEMQVLLNALLPYGKMSDETGSADPLTRELLAVMLYEMLSGYNLAETSGEPQYSDAGKITGDYLDAVIYAYRTGLMRGIGGGFFDPKGIVNRAQAAAVLNNIITVCLFNDNGELADTAFAYFLEISKIPRGSGNEKAVSDYLKSFGEERGFETVQDDYLNILIKKPGSKGRENEPPVILQAHMDMVCEKNQGSEHDFLKDPIIPVTDGDWVKANGTTLGADNGAGLAMILAVLDLKNISHPPIEAVITTEEETTSAGVIGFDASLLSGRRLINIDSEEEGIFTVSSAAGTVADITIPIKTEAVPAGFTSYKLTVKGLTGGHSGTDIHKNLANANILMGRLLKALNNVYVSSINGGSARNAIPRECTAVISLNDLDLVKALVEKMELNFKSEFALDVNLTITLEETAHAADALSGDSLESVLDGILKMPNGALVMSPDIDGLVQTSNNLGVIVTNADEKAIILMCFVRSSSLSDLKDIEDSIQSLAGSLGVGVKAEIENIAPAWPYKADSPLRDKMAEIFKEMYGEEPLIEAVHAGLECADFALKMPDCDIISIGPDISGAHSPDERLSLPSFYRTFDFLVRVLEQIS